MNKYRNKIIDPSGLLHGFKTAVKFLTAVLALMYALPASAQGDLMITPRRIVFEGATRTADINLANTGNDSATYAINLVQIRMLENGGFETITEPDPGQMFADRFVRFFPRTVTLGPNEAQVVKVQLYRTSELQTGEYRSHFYFRAVPEKQPLGETSTTADTSTFSVRLTPIFGITIPVIIRSGETTASVTLSGLDLTMVNDNVPRLSFVFNRTGNMSVYGDITVDHISTQGKITRVGVANGVAVYTPNELRRFQFDLNNDTGVDFKNGTLRVIYSASSDVKPSRLAEAELALK
ncbi:MAG: molecular chaperone [Bacteroidales bacterium]|nr:molecular chaperone [Bacteroidales bacterium]